MKVTEDYIKKLVEEVLREENYAESAKLLREVSMWEKFKGWSARLGSLEKGGEIMLPNKAGKVVAAAEDELQKVIKKHDIALGKASQGLVKQLIDSIRETWPDFPNQTGTEEFKKSVDQIRAVYYMLKAGVDKFQPGLPPEKQPEGYIDPITANAVLKPLRAFVSQAVDYGIGDTFKHANESLDRFSEEERSLLAEMNLTEEEEKELLRTKYGEKGGTQKGLESNLLPVVLGLASGVTGGAGVMLMNMAKDPTLAAELAQVSQKDPKEVVEFVEGAMGEAVSQSTKGHGLLWALNQAGDGGTGGIYELQSNLDQVAENSNVDVQDVIQDFAADAGKHPQAREAIQALYDFQAQGGDLTKVIVKDVPSEEFQQFVTSNANKYGQEIAQTLNDPGAWSGHTPDSVLAVNPVTWTMAAKKALVPIIHKAAPVLKVYSVSSRGMAAAAATGAIGTVAAYLGLGGALAAAGIKLARKKGLKSSRAATFFELEEEMKDFEIPAELEPVSTPEPEGEPDPEEEPPQTDPEDLPGGPPAPEPTKPLPPEGGPAPTDKTRIGLVRLDHDPYGKDKDGEGVKVHLSTHRSDQGRKLAKDLFSKAQDQGVIGSPGTFFGDPVNTNRNPPGGIAQRPGTHRVSGPRPADLSYSQLDKLVKGRSRRDPDTHLAVDASIAGDIVKTIRGIKNEEGKGAYKVNAKAMYPGIKKATQQLLKDLITKKIKSTSGNTARVVKSSIFSKSIPRPKKGDEQALKYYNEAVAAVVNIFAGYGLSETEEEKAARKKDQRARKNQKARDRRAAARKGAPEEEPQGRQRGLGAFTTASPETGVRENLNEQLERWHTLAGVKK